MDTDTSRLYHLIKEWNLDWRHPELKRIVRKIEGGRIRPPQSRRWLKKVTEWAEQERECPNPFGQAPGSQEAMGQFDVEVGTCLENPSVRIGIKLLDRAGRSVVAAGCTGSGKSNLIRSLIYGIDALNRAYDRSHQHPGAGPQG